MRNVFGLLVMAGLLSLSACGAKQTEETTSTPAETTNATDIAETTAAPVDTAGLLLDSTSVDSVKIQ